MSYSVYIILCDDKSFYTGYTENLNRRIKLHEAGKGARYTKMHRPKKLVYVEKFNSRKDAMRREKNQEIKPSSESPADKIKRKALRYERCSVLTRWAFQAVAAVLSVNDFVLEQFAQRFKYLFFRLPSFLRDFNKCQSCLRILQYRNHFFIEFVQLNH